MLRVQKTQYFRNILDFSEFRPLLSSNVQNHPTACRFFRSSIYMYILYFVGATDTTREYTKTIYVFLLTFRARPGRRCWVHGPLQAHHTRLFLVASFSKKTRMQTKYNPSYHSVHIHVHIYTMCVCKYSNVYIEI